MKNTFQLVLGDWSNDGHGMTENYELLTDASKENIEAAYVVGSTRLDINMNNIAANYQDPYMKGSDLIKLINAGYDPTLSESDWGSTLLDELTDTLELEEELTRDLLIKNLNKFGNNEEIPLSCEDFAEIFMFIVCIGDPLIKYVLKFNNANTNIYIGGYGLFDH